MEALMSKIRFIHTDYLRLATPVSGIADAPDWLRQLATNCVRQATRNVIDAAIAREVDFLLIAGGVTESSLDLPAAVEWLSHQFARLNQHGIQVVVTANDHHEASLLRDICDLVLSPGDQFSVSQGHGHQCQIHPQQTSSPATNDLVVCVGRKLGSIPGRTVYNAVPAILSSENCGTSTHNGLLQVSAGAVQAVGPNEALEFGCVLVESDGQHTQLSSEFIVTDVIRFATEDLDLSASTTVDSLATAILQASDSIGKSLTQTAVVDWCVNAELLSEFSNISRFSETEMLNRLRSDVQAGHRGVWPRRIEFTEDSNLKVSSPGFESVQEYIEVVSGAVSSFDLNRFSHGQPLLQGESGVDPTLISGLGLLGKVA